MSRALFRLEVHGEEGWWILARTPSLEVALERMESALRRGDGDRVLIWLERPGRPAHLLSSRALEARLSPAFRRPAVSACPPVPVGRLARAGRFLRRVLARAWALLAEAVSGPGSRFQW